MAISHNVVQNEDGSTITASFTWTSESATDHLDATTFLDVSSLDEFGAVEKVYIERVWLDSQLSPTGSNRPDDAVGIYLTDSTNVPLVTYGVDSSGSYNYCDFGGYDSKGLTPSATGDVKIAAGQSYNRTSGAVDSTNGLQAGSGFTITVQFNKFYEED